MPGQVFDVSLFKEGDYVNVSGTSKGRGFTGVIKRHNFLGVNVKLTEMDTLKELQVLSDKLLTQVGFFLV